MSTGTADSGQAAGQDAPVDLVSVREAAQALGISVAAIYYWGRLGRVTMYPGARKQLISLADVRALAPSADPDTPADAVPIYDARSRTDVPRGSISAWVKQGWLPSWRGRSGPLVRVADVRALATQRAAPVLAAATADTPMPADALVIRDAAGHAGVSRQQVYVWITRGLLPVWPGTKDGQRVRLADVVALAQRPERALPPRPEREP